MSKIQLIAMDMDGTLLNSQQQISDANLQALRDAVAAGIHIAICTGRTCNDAGYFASDAGLNTCHIISLNGACAADGPLAAPYARHVMDADAADGAIALLKRHNVSFACFQQDRVIVLESDYRIPEKKWGTYIGRKDPAEYAYGWDALNRFKAEGICKIVYIDHPGNDRLPKIQQELKGLSKLDITCSWRDNLELVPHGVDKGVALAALTRKLGLKTEQVMAIGDFDNDLGMIRFAGCGVAMGNATENVRRAADVMTATNLEDGVAKAIRQYALND